MDQQQIQEKLAELWRQHLPEIQERVGVLERACAVLETRRLSGEERQTAVAAAHKLAGGLGTFGRMRGTQLAREAEAMLESGKPEWEPMRSLLRQLREIVGK
ncbi:MAG TPA: Hpt domain-containing protein [Terriglobales bacterium]|nr:Hpt domain-containing protein [Terriglobales bacterium]